MTEWTVDSPQRLTLDGPVTRLDVRLVSGRLNVVATDGPPRVDVTRVGRRPVRVEHRDGRLSVRQPRGNRWRDMLFWAGPLARLPRVDVSVAIPADVLADLHLTEAPWSPPGCAGRQGPT